MDRRMHIELWMEHALATLSLLLMNGILNARLRFSKTSAPMLFAVLIATFLLLAGCSSDESDAPDLSAYEYRDTRDLVRFTYDAAQILKSDGLKSLDYFRANRSHYRTPDFYLYIYDEQGNNLFHAGMPWLEGRNLSDLSDINGKQVSRLIMQALDAPDNPHGWVHYSWWEPGKFYPVPKSSCHFRVKTPEGKVLFAGAGIDYPHEEKAFVRIVVDGAVSLIEKKGPEAISEIADPTSSFNFRDVRVFAFYPDGSLLISPVLNDRVVPIQLLECRDEVGNPTFANGVNRLETSESDWSVFMAKSRYQRGLVKKCLYLRKTHLEGKLLYVGAVTDLPQPP